MRTRFCLFIATSVFAASPASAQWLNYETPGIPRLPDGKPNLAAPARAQPRPTLAGTFRS